MARFTGSYVFSKTLVSLQRTLLLSSYTLSFNLTLILQSPYFFDNTVSFKSYWFFLYPSLLYSNTASCICLLWIIHFFAFHHTCISTTCDLKILGFWTAPQFIWKLCPSIPTSYAESSGANEYAKKIWQKHDSRQSHIYICDIWYIWCMHRYSLILLRTYIYMQDNCENIGYIHIIYTNIPWAPKTYQQKQKKMATKKKKCSFLP